MSLPGQIARCKTKLEGAGYAVVETLAVAWSSMDLYACPEFQRLRSLVASRKIRGIGLLDRDRLEAKGLQRLIFFSECREADVELIFCQGPELVDGPEGQLVELALSMGKEKSNMRAQEGSRDALRDRVVKDRLPTSWHRLWGYTPDPPNVQYVPDDNWPHLKLLCDLAKSGKKSHEIITELERSGIPSPTGLMEWTPTMILTIIHNPAYAGRYVALRRRSREPVKRRGETSGKSSADRLPIDEGEYLPEVTIVDPPLTWEERTQILERRAANQRLSRRNAKREYLFRGLIECEIHTGKKGQPRKYRGVPARHGDSYFYTCGHSAHRHLRGPELESAVKNEIRTMFEYPDDNLYERVGHGRTLRNVEPELRLELKRQETRRATLLRNEATLEERFIAGRIDDDVYGLLKLKYQSQREGAESRRDELLIQLAQMGREEEAVQSLSALRDKYLGKLDSLSNEEWRELFSVLNVRITVDTPFNDEAEFWDSVIERGKNDDDPRNEDGLRIDDALFLGGRLSGVLLHISLTLAWDADRVDTVLDGVGPGTVSARPRCDRW